MNLPSNSWNPFDGQLERQAERSGQSVTRIRGPRTMSGKIIAENVQVYENVIVTFIDEDSPRRFEGGLRNLQNVNSQLALFQTFMDVREGDQLLFDSFYWRVQNVNSAGKVYGDQLGWLLMLTREREVGSDA